MLSCADMVILSAGCIGLIGGFGVGYCVVCVALLCCLVRTADLVVFKYLFGVMLLNLGLVAGWRGLFVLFVVC